MSCGQSRTLQPLLADYPEFVEPVVEERHYEAPAAH